MPYPHTGSLGYIIRRRTERPFMVEDPITGVDVERAAFDFTRDLSHALLFDVPPVGDIKGHVSPLSGDGEFSVVVTRKTSESGQIEYRAEFWYPAKVPA